MKKQPKKAKTIVRLIPDILKGQHTRCKPAVAAETKKP